MRAQGRLPEVRHPNGFSRWDEVEGEWIEDSDNDEPAPTGNIGGNNWDVPELMPELGHDDDDEAEFEPARDDDLWQPLMLSLLDMPMLSDVPSVPSVSEVPSVPSVSLPTNAFMGKLAMTPAPRPAEPSKSRKEWHVGSEHVQNLSGPKGSGFHSPHVGTPGATVASQPRPTPVPP